MLILVIILLVWAGAQTGAWRVQNAALLRTYNTIKGNTYSKMQRGRQSLSASAAPRHVELRYDWAQATAALPGGIEDVVNERFLLTGVPAKNVLAVLYNGLDERFCGTNGCACPGQN